MTNKHIIIIWNVRGLNAHARRSSVRELVVQERVSMSRLQETKMDDVPVVVVKNVVVRTIVEEAKLWFTYSRLLSAERAAAASSSELVANH